MIRLARTGRTPRRLALFPMLLAAFALTACGGGGGGGGGDGDGQPSVGPRVKVVYPDSGSPEGGEMVTIVTEGFEQNFETSAPEVRFGGFAGTVNVLRPNVIEVQTPICPEGPCDVTVQTAGGEQAVTIQGGFEFAWPEPRLVSVSPSLGDLAGGEIVTISTRGFDADFTSDPVDVLFGGKPAQIAEPGTGLFRVYSPPGELGRVDVVIRSPVSAQEAGLVACFDYKDVQPGVVLGVSPTTGSHAGGSNVTIRTRDFGDNFLQSLPKVFLGANPADVTAIDGTTLEVVTPAHPNGGAVDIRIETTGYVQSAMLPGAYTYDWPELVSVAPRIGHYRGGTTVTISVRNFVDDFTNRLPAVTFGSIPAVSVRAIDASRLEVVSPAQPAGGVDVVVEGTGFVESASMPRGFAYEEPRIEGVHPSEGSPGGGAVVTVGTAVFADDFTVDLPQVLFGGTPAASVVALNPHTLEVVTPAHEKGTVTVVIETTGDPERVEMANGFVYGSPKVRSVSPPCGLPGGGTAVTIFTSSFDVDFTTALPEIYFGGELALDIQAVDATTLSARTPAHAAARVNVRVEFPGGESAVLVNGYQYANPGTE